MRSRSTGSIGAALPDSRRTKRYPRPTVTATSKRNRPNACPCPSPSMLAMSRPKVAALRTAPHEQPWPMRHRQNAAGDGRADSARHSDHHRIDADATPQKLLRIDEAQQRGVHAHDARRAEALDHARTGQHRQSGGESAAQRCDGENRQPPQINAPVTGDVAQRRQRQQRDRDGELIAVHHPDRSCGIGVQVDGDGGQRHIGDGGVDDGQRDAERDGEDRPITGGQRQAVFVSHCAHSIRFAAKRERAKLQIG